MNKKLKIFEDNGLVLNRCMGSKSGYRKRFPENDIIFNSNIYISSENKIWYGDIDITLEKKNLQKICNQLNEDIIILYEMEGRFENEGKSYDDRLDHAHIMFTPNNTSYKKRIYEGYEFVTTGNVTTVKDKGFKWETIKI